MLRLFAAYLITHFLAYLFLYRHAARFRTERAIFLYHFLPATVSGLAALLYAFAESAFGDLALLLSVHGIYSLSFLEVWSLAQGGYSLSVLRSVARAEGEGVEPDFSYLQRIGETKQRERISALAHLKLIAENDGQITLTMCGRGAAALLHCLLRWIASVNDGSEVA
jgi:hypothetical protein